MYSSQTYNSVFTRFQSRSGNLKSRVTLGPEGAREISPLENFEIFNSQRCILLHFKAMNSKFIWFKNTEVYSFIN